MPARLLRFSPAEQRPGRSLDSGHIIIDGLAMVNKLLLTFEIPDDLPGHASDQHYDGVFALYLIRTLVRLVPASKGYVRYARITYWYAEHVLSWIVRICLNCRVGLIFSW